MEGEHQVSQVQMEGGVDAPEGTTPTQRPLRIAQVLTSGSQWGDVGPLAIEKGIGGRETAVIMLGHKWAEMGHHVECIVPTRKSSTRGFPNGGRIDFIPLAGMEAFLRFTHHDVIVSWEDSTVFDHPDVIRNSHLRVIGMQVAHLDLAEEQLPNIDAIVCLSDWAVRFLNESLGGMVPDEKFFVIPNGVDLSRYPYYGHDVNRVRRNQKFFVYSSSPDRGLHHLLRLWPRVRREVMKDATLQVAYGVTQWTEHLRWSHNIQGEIAREIAHRIKTTRGVIDIGRVGQSKLAHIQAMSCMMPYPCDTFQPTETGCISVVEAMAAMCPVVTTDCDSLGEQYAHAAEIVPLPFDESRYLDAMHGVIHQDDRYFELQDKGRVLAVSRSWDRTSTTWASTLRLLLARI